MDNTSRHAVQEILATMEMLHERAISAFMEDAKTNAASCARMPITLPQARALEVVSTNHGLNNKQLAQMLQVTPASASAMVERLVELKLVKRYVPNEDRRTVKLQVSALGEKTLRTHRQIIEGVIADLFDRLGDTDARKWLQVSRKLRNILTPTHSKTDL